MATSATSKVLMGDDIIHCCDGIIEILNNYESKYTEKARNITYHILDDVAHCISARDLAAMLLCYTYPKYGVLLEDLPNEAKDEVSDYVRDFFADKGIPAKRSREEVEKDDDDDDDDSEDEKFEVVYKRKREIEDRAERMTRTIDHLLAMVTALQVRGKEADRKLKEAQEDLDKCDEILKQFKLDNSQPTNEH